ncbi:MAG TPA: hypothetical protein PLB97_00030 [Accumulibacter sp.]|jgi:Cu/Ag efflux pump CusA|nr:hypothetical protein [Accumulibacter sp.]HPP45970.1 hypothetical protein [Accumulibacter sp.]HQO29373.1 hypothetical protein [Accumulibacter sp.]
MPQIFNAFASQVKVNDETIEGLQSIEFAQAKNRQDIGAIGSDERIAVYFGLKRVSGRLRVASANATLDKLLQDNSRFSITAALKHADQARNLSFDDCYLDDKSFAMSAQGHGETVYAFTATRLREE